MIEIKRRDNGEVIHSGDFDTIKECLEDGVLKGISFFRADLNDAELNGAKLNGAKLNDAELNGAELNYAELNGAKLNGAKLNGAKLNDASFKYITGNTHGVYCLQHGDYKLAIIGDICFGGCTKRTLQEWLDYSGDNESESDRKYLENVTKPFIKMVINIQEG